MAFANSGKHTVDELTEESSDTRSEVWDGTVSSIASTAATKNMIDIDCSGMQIICVGVMRTGLKTLHRALRNLGYSNIYDQEEIVSKYDKWCDVLRNRATKATFASIFEGNEVIMGMPTFCFWEQLVEIYPQAKIILTVRSEDEWWESVKTAKMLMDNELPGSPLRYGSVMRQVESLMVPSYHKFCQVLRFAWNTTLGAQGLDGDELNEVAARGNYRRHNSYVRNCFEKDESRFLVYDVRDGWEPLCKFLGKDVPGVDFPTALRVAYFPGAQGSEKRCDSDGQESVASREEKMADDIGQEFEELLMPHSEFGMRMRRELRRSLAVGTAVLTGLFAFIFGGLWIYGSSQVPALFLALAYVGVITIGWTFYVVMHGMVMRVPALLVLPMAMKSLLIAAALHACFLSYGVLKEMLVTQDKVSSPVLVLSSRVMSIICAAVAMLAADGRISFGAPLHAMSAFAFTNEASTWAGYEMLKYVSFPVQVMAKCCNMLPNMMMGRALNGTRYSLYQYTQAVAAVICVIIMHVTDGHIETRGTRNGSPDGERDGGFKLFMGVTCMVVFFVCDSFTSQWQTALYKKHQKISQTQMMLGGNLMGFVFTTGSAVLNWADIRRSLGRAVEHPEVMGRIVALGVVSALGSFCIYSAIRILGPLSFAWIMTARQLLSVLISLLFFGHGISFTKLLCILTVFAIMSSKQLQRIVPRGIPCKGRSRDGQARASFVRRMTGFYAPRPDPASKAD